MITKVHKATLDSAYFGKNFNPFVVNDVLEEYGFVFLSKGCPTKFAGTIEQTINEDKSVTFVQTLEE